MKKILKKLFILALVIGVLAPYIEIPIVKADSCSNHVQHYLFLDHNVLRVGNETLFEYYDAGSSVNATIFPYEFPIGEDVEIVDVNLNQLTGSSDIRDYIALHNTVILYTQSESQNAYRSTERPELYGDTFVSSSTREYASSSILLHGQWGNLDGYFEPQENNWSYINPGDDSDYPFEQYVLQKTPLNSYMEVSLYKGEIDRSGNATPGSDSIEEASDLDYLVETPLEELEAEDLLYWEDEDLYGEDVNKYFVPIAIERNLDSFDDFDDDVIFGYYTDGALFAFGESSESVVTVDSIKNSYEKYKDFVNGGGTNTAGYVTQITSGTIPSDSDDFNENPSYYGISFNTGAAYYWPFILTVEYETCSTPSSSADKWSLEYNGNHKDAKNIPAGVSDILEGESVKLANGPERTGYTFKKWCTDKDGKGSCYNAGDNFKNETGESKVILYAQWGDTNTTNNGDTGVFSYVISFIAVGAIAGTIYFVSKKKNLFKQI